MHATIFPWYPRLCAKASTGGCTSLLLSVSFTQRRAACFDCFQATPLLPFFFTSIICSALSILAFNRASFASTLTPCSRTLYAPLKLPCSLRTTRCVCACVPLSLPPSLPPSLSLSLSLCCVPTHYCVSALAAKHVASGDHRRDAADRAVEARGRANCSSAEHQGDCISFTQQ